MTATELGPPDKNSQRTQGTDRLLAESLIQTQRPRESLPWWDWLIEHEQTQDFSTLLRGAETAVAYCDADLAEKRIEAVREAAGSEPFHLALVQLLGAELSVRRVHFEEARKQLDELVRNQTTDAALRGRAQWLIGETYFMQQKYVEAIDAYRQVDAMDSTGLWAPAALLQAGKAYEKLGRSHDAVICYTALLKRFADWPQASLAQSRLATLHQSVGGEKPLLR